MPYWIHCGPEICLNSYKQVAPSLGLIQVFPSCQPIPPKVLHTRFSLATPSGDEIEILPQIFDVEKVPEATCAAFDAVIDTDLVKHST